MFLFTKLNGSKIKIKLRLKWKYDYTNENVHGTQCVKLIGHEPYLDTYMDSYRVFDFLELPQTLAFDVNHFGMLRISKVGFRNLHMKNTYM